MAEPGLGRLGSQNDCFSALQCLEGCLRGGVDAAVPLSCNV